MGAAIGRVVTNGFRRDLWKVTSGAVLAFVGVVSGLISLMRWRRREHALFYFGLFALVYGVRLVLQTAIAPLLGISYPGVWFIVSGLTYFINVPAALFALEIIRPGWKSSLRWLARAAILLVVVGIPLGMTGG